MPPDRSTKCVLAKNIFFIQELSKNRTKYTNKILMKQEKKESEVVRPICSETYNPTMKFI